MLTEIMMSGQTALNAMVCWINRLVTNVNLGKRRRILTSENTQFEQGFSRCSLLDRPCDLLTVDAKISVGFDWHSSVPTMVGIVPRNDGKREFMPESGSSSNPTHPSSDKKR
jgi:hypothetical protein